MNILIVYATYSSSTESASVVVEETLAQTGHSVKRQPAKDTQPEDFASYDLVIFGSPSWEVDKKDGQPHIDFGELMKRAAGKTYREKKFAVFGLGDIHYAHFTGAVDSLVNFVTSLQGSLIGEPLRISRYYFDEDTNAQTVRDWSKTLI